MLSFRSILLAAAAFATLTSAIPTPIPDSGAALGPLSGLGTTVTGITGNVGGNMKRGDYSVADYFYNCHENLLEIVVKITDAVHCEGGADKVDHVLVISLLGEIVVLLQGLLANLKVLVVADLTLNGVACTLEQLAGVITVLVFAVIDIVVVVLDVVGFVDLKLCGVIAVIGGLLCQILTVVFALLVSIKVIIIGLFGGYVNNCKYAKFDDLLVLLKL